MSSTKARPGVILATTPGPLFIWRQATAATDCPACGYKRSSSPTSNHQILCGGRPGWWLEAEAARRAAARQYGDTPALQRKRLAILTAICWGVID